MTRHCQFHYLFPVLSILPYFVRVPPFLSFPTLTVSTNPPNHHRRTPPPPRSTNRSPLPQQRQTPLRLFLRLLRRRRHPLPRDVRHWRGQTAALRNHRRGPGSPDPVGALPRLGQPLDSHPSTVVQHHASGSEQGEECTRVVSGHHDFLQGGGCGWLEGE